MSLATRMGPVKVLMIGLGGVGQRHLRNLKSLLGDRLSPMAYRVRRRFTVVTDQLTLEENRNIELEFGIRVFTDLSEALAEGPEIAFICNPTSLHLDAAIAAAKAGCHLFVEKPLSHSLRGVSTLSRVAKSKRLVIAVGYQMRFHPVVRRIRTLLDQRAIGRIASAELEIGEYLPGWHPYEDYRQMYASRRDLGGGVVLSQIHELDYLYWFWGVPSRVFAMGGQLGALGIDVEDTASVLMEYELEGRRVPVHLHMDYLQRPACRTCKIVGDEGMIVADLRSLSVNLFDRNGALVEANSFQGLERNQLFEDEVREFLECVGGQGAPSVGLEDARQSLRMALLIRKSMDIGRVLRFPGLRP